MRARAIGVAAAAALVTAAVGALSLAGARMAEAQAQDGVVRVDNFRLTDAALQSYELYRMGDAKAVVLVTHAAGCVATAADAPALKALAGYRAKGVEVLMLDSSLKDTRETAAAEAKRLGLDLPVLMDSNQLAGEQLGVTRTGEAIVVDPKGWRVAWRGPAGEAATALDAVMAGGTPRASGRASRGCAIDFPERGKAAQHAAISYARQVAPIIEQKCVGCHQSGGIGPMQFTSYEQVRGFAPMIREVVRTRRMPPWHAEPGISSFHDDKGLTAAEIKTLVHWVEAGAPRGSGADPLAAKRFQAAEWPLGKPDLIIDIPAYKIPASGVVAYQRPFAVNPLTEGKWVRASTFKVGERQAVHHILTGYMTEAPAAGAQALESRWGASFGTYAVGTESVTAPDDVGTFMPAGGAIGFQNHYTPYGKEVVDNSQLGLYFYKSPPKMVMRTMTIMDPTISIPPNTERHEEVAYLTFPKEALLYGAFIHAHYRGSGSKLSIRYPDGTEKLLIAVPRYDFNWQRDYDFAEPVKVPAGSKLIAHYVYDNSKRNPSNPDPNRTVPWGEQSYDEMLYTTLRYRWTEETSDKPVTYDDQLTAGRLFGMLDDNMNDRLELAELRGTMAAALRAGFSTADANQDGHLDAGEIAAIPGLGARLRRQQ